MSAPKFTVPGYEVAPDGAVYALTGWRGCLRRLMDQAPNSNGYMRVRLTIGGRRKSFMVHRLVVETFIGPRPSAAHEVRHLDGDKTNNRVENLAWGTRQDNADDRARHGRTRNGFMAGTTDRAAHRSACKRAALAKAVPQ